MSENKNDENTSADDILNDLANQMGVQEDTSGGEAAPAAEPAAAEPAAAEPAAAEPAAAAPKVEKKVETKADKKADKSAGSKEAAKASPAPKAAPAKPSPADENVAGVKSLFTGTGSESPLGDPHKHIYFSDEDTELDESTSPKSFVIGLVLAIAVVGIGFFALGAEKRTDAIRMLQGYDIAAEREMRAQAEKERRDKERMEAMPKYGTVSIVTDPSNLRVSSPGQPEMIFPGSRTDIAVPSRTRVTFQDISVKEPFTFTIHGDGNFADKTVTMQPFGDAATSWQQTFSGSYQAELTFMVCWPGEPPRVSPENCIDPLPAKAAELKWRRDWRPDPNAVAVPGQPDPTRLPGTITVNSDPPGALIVFNGRQLMDEATSQPLRTPHTFSTYNAPPGEDRTPLPVYLSREGLRLQLMPPDETVHVPTVMGVFSHMFTCDLKPGAVPPVADPANPTLPPDWYGLCDYKYEVSLKFREVPPPPPAGSGEGSGAAPTGRAP